MKEERRKEGVQYKMKRGGKVVKESMGMLNVICILSFEREYTSRRDHISFPSAKLGKFRHIKNGQEIR